MVKSHRDIVKNMLRERKVVTHHSKKVITKRKMDRFKPVITLGQDQNSLAVHDPANFYQMVKGITIDMDQKRRVSGFDLALDQASETYLIDLFNETDLYTIHTKRNGSQTSE